MARAGHALHHRPLHADHGAIPGAARAGRGRSPGRCPVDTALADQPAVQSGGSARDLERGADRLPAPAGTRRPEAPAPGRRALAEWILAERLLPRVCGLRGDGTVPRRARGALWPRRNAPLRHHVCGGGLVAMPPADHRRLPAGEGACGAAHSRRQPYRSRNANARRAGAREWDSRLSGTRALSRPRRAWPPAPAIRACILCRHPPSGRPSARPSVGRRAFASAWPTQTG